MAIDDEKLIEKYDLFWKSIGLWDARFTNYDLAYKTCKELSDEGYDYATLLLGICYCDGIGTACDKQRGIALIEKVQNANFPIAAALLVNIADLETNTYKNALATFKGVAGQFSNAYRIDFYRRLTVK